MKSWPKVKLGQVQVSSNIAQNHSYSPWKVMSDHYSHEKLARSEIWSSSSRFEHCSESLIWPIGSHSWSLFAPIHMKSWPRVKLGQIQVGSNITQNHSSSPWEVIYGHCLPQFTWKVDQKWYYVKFRWVRTLLRITRIAHKKSCLIIICPNSHKKLAKNEIRSSSSRFEHCSESLI